MSRSYKGHVAGSSSDKVKHHARGETPKGRRFEFYLLPLLNVLLLRLSSNLYRSFPNPQRLTFTLRPSLAPTVLTPGFTVGAVIDAYGSTFAFGTKERFPDRGASTLKPT